MNKRFALLSAAFIAALAATLLFAGLSRAGAPAPARTVSAAPADHQSPMLDIRAPQRISIPYGIAPILPLLGEGRDVVVYGHGGCTAEETVTIAISITQPVYGAVALGEIVEECTGALDHWQLTATAVTTASLTPGPAEACGTATTRLDDEVTDVMSWCRAEPAQLVEFTHHLHLPLLARSAVE